MHVNLPVHKQPDPLHVNLLLHLPWALWTMVHVHLHAHFRSHGDSERPGRASSEVPSMMIGGSAVLEPLWGEIFAPQELPGVGVVSHGIAPRREAVHDAREFTRATLQLWDLGVLFDDVALVASELVTNALRHAVRTDGVEHGTAQPEGWRTPIRLSLAREATRVVCAVRDPSCVGPVTRTPDHVSETGRGLHLVDCFSETWGWHLLDGTGKIVWAVFRLPGEELSHTA